MELLFINNLFSERFARALCWTLLHSLWQGLLLAILTGLIILLTRRSGAAIRYRLFSGLFGLFLLGSCCTFIVEWGQGAGAAPVEAAPFSAPMIRIQAPAPTGPVYLHAGDRMVDYFNTHASFLVLVWLLICAMRLVQILAQFGTIERLRHTRVHSVEPRWEERLQELARHLGIRVPVKLLESELVSIPMMAGFLKPLILLPFQLTLHLPAGEVEAILLHELAHIKRRDYLVNLMQSVAGAFFFFNPGVLWISALLREERENCCDDMAIGHGGSKKAFVKALVGFQQQTDKEQRFALAFPGAGNHLLHRVRRIVHKKERALDIRETFFLFCCLMITGSLLLGFSRTDVPHAGKAATAKVLRRTAPKMNGSMIMSQPLKDTANPAETGKTDSLKKPKKVRKVEKAAKAEKTEQKEKVEKVEAEKPEKVEKREKAKTIIIKSNIRASYRDSIYSGQAQIWKDQRPGFAMQENLEQREMALGQKDMIQSKPMDTQKAYVQLQRMKLNSEQKALLDMENQLREQEKELRRRRMAIDQEQRALDQEILKRNKRVADTLHFSEPYIQH